MRLARWITAFVGSILLLLAAVGTASAGQDMTYNMTYNSIQEMTYN
jgi:hypothetical protein